MNLNTHSWKTKPHGGDVDVTMMMYVRTYVLYTLYKGEELHRRGHQFPRHTYVQTTWWRCGCHNGDVRTGEIWFSVLFFFVFFSSEVSLLRPSPTHPSRSQHWHCEWDEGDVVKL